MVHPAAKQHDPRLWSLVIAALFFALGLIRLVIPSAHYFDEVHYLPATYWLLDGEKWLNREHPMLGKEILALSMALLGDNPLGWRLPSLIAGSLALFASMRALWFASLSRFAALAYGVLLASGFFLFVHARIAMLDIFMVAFLMAALWQCAAAMREPETGRWRLALAGVAIGLSMASKWNVLPLAMLPGLAFLAARLAAGRRRLFTSQRGIPVPGVSLIEAGVWLGLLPLTVYALTWVPAMLVASDPLAWDGLVHHHRIMLEMQESVVQPHPYQSQWADWVFNLRGIWYLYEPIDGAQRGILLIGNPLTMMLGLVALVWCLWAGVMRRRWDALAALLFYVVGLGMWWIAPKPVQFYYHYFLPSMALLAALALMLAELHARGWRRTALAIPAASLAVFAWFYPILSAAPLAGPQSFAHWMWLSGWR